MKGLKDWLFDISFFHSFFGPSPPSYPSHPSHPSQLGLKDERIKGLVIRHFILSFILWS